VCSWCLAVTVFIDVRYREVCGLHEQLKSLLSTGAAHLTSTARSAMGIDLRSPELSIAKNTSRVMELRRLTIESFLVGVSSDPVLQPLVLTWLFPGAPLQLYGLSSLMGHASDGLQVVRWMLKRKMS
jgi:hypothetical protein